MNFWTSVLAVFIADGILTALKFNAVEAFFILTVTLIIYLIVTAVIDKWNEV
jgi:uncharacterized membrane protein HdeD (DUF308 family)